MLVVRMLRLPAAHRIRLARETVAGFHSGVHEDSSLAWYDSCKLTYLSSPFWVQQLSRSFVAYKACLRREFIVRTSLAPQLTLSHRRVSKCRVAASRLMKIFLKTRQSFFVEILVRSSPVCCFRSCKECRLSCIFSCPVNYLIIMSGLI
jgi:hypothetical protein